MNEIEISSRMKLRIKEDSTIFLVIHDNISIELSYSEVYALQEKLSEISPRDEESSFNDDFPLYLEYNDLEVEPTYIDGYYDDQW
jgi:hypothetical protein